MMKKNKLFLLYLFLNTISSFSWAENCPEIIALLYEAYSAYDKDFPEHDSDLKSLYYGSGTKSREHTAQAVAQAAAIIEILQDVYPAHTIAEWLEKLELYAYQFTHADEQNDSEIYPPIQITKAPRIGAPQDASPVTVNPSNIFTRDEYLRNLIVTGSLVAPQISGGLSNLYVLKTGDTMTGSLTLANQQSIIFDDTASGAVTIKAPTDVTSSYILQLPQDAGTSGQLLTSNGTAPDQLYWTTATPIDIPNTVVARDNTGSFTATTITATGFVQVTDTTGELAGSVYGTQTALVIAPQGPRALQASGGGNTRGSYAIDLQMSITDNTQVASGAYAVIMGGQNNSASGNYAAVIGGQNNRASGANSVALGQNADAAFDYSFVFADGQNGTFSAQNPNSFNIRAANGLTLQGTGPDSITLLVPSSLQESYGLTFPLTTGLAGQVLATDGNNPAQLSWVAIPNDLTSTATSADIPLTLVLRDTTGSFAATTITATGAFIVTDQTGAPAGSLSANTAACIIAPQGTRAFQINAAGNSRGNYAIDLQSVFASSSEVASGNYAVIIGGQNNTASGNYAVAIGGQNNIASGDYGIALGQNAVAGFNNSFVWADGQTGSFSAQSADSFNIRAANGLVLQGSSPRTVTLLVPDPLGASYTLTMPLDTGQPGQVLSTDGNNPAQLSWVNSSTQSVIATGTSANIPLTLVLRDTSGSFAATALAVDSLIFEGQTTGSITLQAPPTVPTAYTLQLPSTVGTAGQVLASSGANPDVLYWTTASGIVTSTIQLYGDVVGSSTANRVQTICGVDACTLVNLLTGTSSDIPLTLILRDSTGSFAATTITATGCFLITDQTGTLAGSLCATSSAFIIAPQGDRALQASSGGNPRGVHAIDLQTAITNPTHVASGAQSVITGGMDNTAAGDYSFIGAGLLNTASGIASGVIAGGGNTITGQASATVSGQSVFVFGDSSCAVSPVNSVVVGNSSFIGAGENHTITGTASCIVAGFSNVAQGNYSFVGAGQNNSAFGTGSSVLAGQNNTALGTNSIALGQNAITNADNSFAWADGQSGLFEPVNSDSFNIRAAQGLTLQGAGPNSVTLVVPSALSPSYTLTLPFNTGVAGQVLATDGNNPAQLSWVDNQALSITGTSANIPLTLVERDATGSFAATTVTLTGCLQLLDQTSNLAGTICTTTNALIVAPQSGRALQASSNGNPRGSYAVDLQLESATASNVASGNNAVLIGGAHNTASGDFSAVIGGQNNIAAGLNSIALGFQAVAAQDNSFVFADLQPEIFSSTQPNSFNIRAANGLVLQGSGTSAVTLIVPSTVSTAYGLQLPTSSGAAGQFLQTDGNNPAQLSWGLPSLLATATPANIPNTLVLRDNTGSFAASTITATGALIVTDSTDSIAGTLYATPSALIIAPEFPRALQASSAGDQRGNYAIDLQLSISAQSQVASGTGAVIIGGAYNSASGAYATVIGGQNNNAVGTNSIALGNNAYALGDNSFVWADGQLTTFTVTTANSFNIRAENGLVLQGIAGGVTLRAPSAAPYTLTLPTSSGLTGQVLITDGGTPAQLSWQTFITPTWTSADVPLTLVLRDTTGSFAASNVTLASMVLDGQTSGSITLQAPAATLPYTLTLPTSVGSAGQVLASQGTNPDQLFWTSIGDIVTATIQLYGDVVGSSTATSVQTICGMDACSLVSSLTNAGTPLDIPNTVVRRDDTGSFAATTITTTGCLNMLDSTGTLAATLCANTGAVILAPQGSRSFQLTATGNPRGANAVDLQMTIDNPSQVASGDHSAIIGGAHNTASGQYSFVGGGYGNIASGIGCFVGGGGIDSTLNPQPNTAAGTACAVVGGLNNYANGTNSFVGGGVNNTAGTNSSITLYSCVVIGGQNNSAQSNYSSIIGGANNSIIDLNPSNQGNCAIITGQNNSIGAGTGCFIGGGQNNSIAEATTTAGGCAIIGGSNNIINGTNINTSAIIGGIGNSISGSSTSSFIGGGFDNAIYDSNYSWAGGYSAYTGYNNSFVWSSGPDTTYQAIGSGTFNVYCSGGAQFATAINGGGVMTSGVYLPLGSGGWVSMSDKASKRNYQEVDGLTILKKLVDLPIQSWNYKEQDPLHRHIGPFAQDFNTIFDLGKDAPSGISTIDADGVAFAAIQGMHTLHMSDVQALQVYIDQLETRINQLECELNLQTAMQQVKAGL